MRHGRFARQAKAPGAIHRSFRFVVLVLLLLAAGCLHAQPVVVERFDPHGAAVDARALIDGAHDRDFVAQAYAAVTPSPDRPVWYRIKLGSDWPAEDRPLLSIFDPQGLDVAAYLPPDYAATRRSIYDRSRNAGFTRHALVFDLPHHLSAQRWIYLELAPDKAVPRRIEIAATTDARVRDLDRARLDVLFPAVQIATLLVMAAFLLALRERTYLHFVGHVVFIVLYELYLFGIGYEYFPFALLSPLGARAAWLSATLAALLLFEFSRGFLDLPRVSAPLDRGLRIGRGLMIGIVVVGMLPLTPDWMVEYALACVLLAAAPLLIVAGLVSWQQGSRRSGFYLAAWIPGLLLVVVRALQLILHWPLPAWLEFAMPAALAYASLAIAYGLAEHTLSIRHERDVAHRLAEQDALTGVLNRRAILARLRACLLETRANGEPLSLLFLDLDHFKRVNDSFGHHAGDRCLRELVAPIGAELRQADALGRYGGEEFLVVLPGAGVDDARRIAERIRSRIEQMPVLVSGQRIGLTLSVGVATSDGDALTPAELIECADAALYRSKSGGRNQVNAHRGVAEPDLDARA